MSDESPIDQEVQRLQRKLENALIWQGALKKDLQVLCRSIAHEPNGLISVLPTELLVSIFDQTVLSNPRFVSCLMLVCKDWQNLILSTPLLWSTINITIPSDVKRVKLYATYCSTCVERSAGCPLYITLDFTRISIMEGFLSNILFNVCSLIPGSIYLARMVRFLRDTRALYEWCQAQYLRPLSALSGQMTRWKVFNLSADKFWYDAPLIKVTLSTSLFLQETPSLEILRLRHLPRHQREYHVIIRRNSPVSRAFPNLSDIRELILENFQAPINVASIDTRKITRICLMAYNVDQYRLIVSCRNLTRLHFGIGYSQSIKWRNPGIGPRIEFPSLVHLQVVLFIPPEFWQLLIAPVLRTIVLEDFGALRSFKHITLLESVSKLELRHGYIRPPWSPLIRRTLCIIMPKLPAVTTLLCTSANQNFINSLLLGLSEEGHRFRSLVLMLIVSPQECHGDIDPADCMPWTPTYLQNQMAEYLIT